MTNVKIDGKDYDLNDLSNTAKDQLSNLQFVQGELKRLEAKVAVFKTSEAAYGRALNNFLPESD